MTATWSCSCGMRTGVRRSSVATTTVLFLIFLHNFSKKIAVTPFRVLFVVQNVLLSLAEAACVPRRWASLPTAR